MLNRTHRLATIIVLLLLVACRPIPNYDDPDGPLFVGNYADRSFDFEGTVKVITWNIKFSEEIDTAIAELKNVEDLQGADIILLQEMDEAGVESIAQSLNYNYVYFPASIHTHHDKNFGNAILAKWPLSDPTKLILPHANPKNRQTRIVVRAIVTVADTEVTAYSVHSETNWLSSQKRNEQLGAMLDNINQDSNYVIAGGDFNTFSSNSISEFEKRFEQLGLERVSAGTGPTFEYGAVVFTPDHVFAKNLSAIEAGVWSETQASDHFPVWVDLRLEVIGHSPLKINLKQRLGQGQG